MHYSSPEKKPNIHDPNRSYRSDSDKQMEAPSYRRRRIAAVTVGICALGALGFIINRAIDLGNGVDCDWKDPIEQTVEANSGYDNFATRYKGSAGLDIRDITANIREHNQNGVLQPGQVVFVPRTCETAVYKP